MISFAPLQIIISARQINDHMLPKNQWPFGKIMCHLWHIVIYINMFVQIIFLTLMAIDRYLAVVRHGRLMKLASYRNSRPVIGKHRIEIIWIRLRFFSCMLYFCLGIWFDIFLSDLVESCLRKRALWYELERPRHGSTNQYRPNDRPLTGHTIWYGWFSSFWTITKPFAYRPVCGSMRRRSWRVCVPAKLFSNRWRNSQ